MPTIVLVAIGAIGLASPALFWALVGARHPARTAIAANLRLGLAPSSVAAEPSATGQQRTTASGRIVSALTPGSMATRLERLLSVAGRPAAWPLPRLLAAKVAGGSGAAGLGLLYLTAAPSAGRFFGVVAVTAIVYFLPEILLYNTGQKRQSTIQLELADTLDQMTIAVEAGLGFDSAMARAGKNGKGPLAEELVRTLQDVQVGVPRRDALRGLASRTTVTDLRRFVTALLQADAYGVALGDVLRTQSVEMRRKRRQRAEEAAMKIPVKVIFPLILFILPTLFIVLLGPAVMDMVQVFGDGGV